MAAVRKESQGAQPLITRRRFIKSLVAGVGALIVAPSLVLPYEPKVIYSIPLQSYEGLRAEAIQKLSEWFAKEYDEAMFRYLTGGKPKCMGLFTG